MNESLDIAKCHQSLGYTEKQSKYQHNVGSVISESYIQLQDGFPFVCIYPPFLSFIYLDSVSSMFKERK
jgi:hypothetical protein